MRHRQLSTTRPDGSVESTGVEDAYYFNTDHVPVWYELVGNYSWGRRDSERQYVRTGGKEKGRITVQLGVGKGGKKLAPLLFSKVRYCATSDTTHFHYCHVAHTNTNDCKYSQI